MRSLYFSHDENTREDARIVALLIGEGMAGYGIFWALLEELYKAGGTLPLEDVQRIAFNLHEDELRIKRILELYGLFVVDAQEQCFYNESALRRIAKRTEVSERNRQNVLKRWQQKTEQNDTTPIRAYNDRNATAMRPQCERNASVIRQDDENNKYKILNNNIIKDTNVSMSSCNDAKVDFQEILTYWNSQMQGKLIPQIRDIRGKRKQAVNARIKESSLSEVKEAIRLAASSSFLNGKNDRAWVADFDFVFRPSKFLKVLEGTYNTEEQLSEIKKKREQRYLESFAAPVADSKPKEKTGISFEQFQELKKRAIEGDREALLTLAGSEDKVEQIKQQYGIK